MMPFASVPYCNINDIKSWRLTDNCSSISTFKLDALYNDTSRDSVGIIGHDDTQQYIVVSFRGTQPNNFYSWIDDLQGIEYYASTCKLSDTFSFTGHAGFCDYYLSLKNQGLMQTFVTIQNNFPSYKVYVIGHSLGGAAAGIFALDLVNTYGKGPSNVLLLTFGEPRIGDLSYSNLMSSYSPSQLWRLVHNFDLVPHLGPCCHDLAPYNTTCHKRTYCPWQAATEIWYPQEEMALGANQFKVCSTTDTEDPTCSDQNINTSVYDHLHYFEREVAGQCCF